MQNWKLFKGRWLGKQKYLVKDVCGNFKIYLIQFATVSLTQIKDSGNSKRETWGNRSVTGHSFIRIHRKTIDKESILTLCPLNNGYPYFLQFFNYLSIKICFIQKWRFCCPKLVSIIQNIPDYSKMDCKIQPDSQNSSINTMDNLTYFFII